MSEQFLRRGNKGMIKCWKNTGLVQAITLLLTAGTGLSNVWAQDSTMPGMDSGTMMNMEQGSMPGMDDGTDSDTQSTQQQNTMPSMDHSAMDHSTMSTQAQGNTMPDMDHSVMDHDAMDHGATNQDTMNSSSMPGMNHGAMSDMDHGNAATMSGQDMSGMHDMSGMQGGSAPADARDPHAYSGGYTLDSGPYDLPGPRQLRLADEHNFASLLVDRLEAVRTSDNTSAAYDLQAWYGRDYDRVVLKAEGDYDNGEFGEMSTELLWGHAVASYWNTQLGLRYDSGEGPDRPWLAIGIQGLAPYWFEVDATAYVGEEGRTAVNVEAEYELLLTQKMILQPRVEADFYGKDDSERGIGSGLSEIKVGLRLRYEIRREFAPYVGVEWAGMFGNTADYARTAGVDTKETQAVAGIRFWF